MAIFKKPLLSTLLGCVFFSLGISAPGATHDAVYQINRNGQDIGHFSFAIKGDDNRRDMDVKMSIKVKFLFITVYRATHQRHDIWEHNQLISSVGESQYNRDDYTLKLSRPAANYRWEVNGQAQELPGAVFTFVPWLMDVSGPLTLLSEKGKAEPATFRFVGPETIQLADKPYEARKFELAGKQSRELWYDQAGCLLRVRYQMGGATIEIRLKQGKAA